MNLRAKGFYQDEHERPDVQAYRKWLLGRLGDMSNRLIKRYTPEARELMTKGPAAPGLAGSARWSAEEQACLGVQLRDVNGVQETVLLMIVQDESACNANPVPHASLHKPGVSHSWERTAGKGKGPGMMAEAHVCGFGSIKANEIRTGKQWGWYHNGLFMADVDAVFDQLRENFPSYNRKLLTPLMMYDNSGVHRKFATDALDVSSLPAGEQPSRRRDPIVMRDTTVEVNADGSPKAGSPVLKIMKDDGSGPHGLLHILKQRGCVIDASGRAYDSKHYNADELRSVLGAHPDFLLEKTAVQQVYEAEPYNAIVLYWPRFHADMSAIEMMWSRVKAMMRPHLNGQATVLLSSFRDAWDALPAPFFSSCFRRTERFMVAYDCGMDANLAFRLIYIVTGRGGTGGKHVAHMRVAADAGVDDVERNVVVDAPEDEYDEGEQAVPEKLRGLARAVCLECEERITRGSEASCECCSQTFHCTCLLTEERSDAVAGSTWTICPPCSWAVTAPVADAEEGEAAPGPDAAAAAPARTLTAEEVDNAWRYFTHGMGKSEESLKRLQLVREKFHGFLQHAAKVMSNPAYPGGEVDLLTKVCTPGATPRHFWYCEVEAQPVPQ
jgi:hypothetical protein